MKLLDLPALVTHILGSLRGVLSQVVGGDIVRALGREHKPEEFHPMTGWKSIDDK
jgi:hypothetical protein